MITQESNSEAILHNCLHTRKHKETWEKKMQTVQILFFDCQHVSTLPI